MTRQHLVEILEHGERFLRGCIARQPAAIGLDHAQRRRIQLVGALEPLAGFFGLSGQIQNHAGMQVLEDRVPVRACELVDRSDRAFGVAAAIHRPCAQQSRGQVGDRPADRLDEVRPRRRILLLLERAHADNQPRNTIVLVVLQDAFGVTHRFVDVAIDEERQERAVEQRGVLWIEPQRRAVIGGRRARFTLLAGMTRREVTARCGDVGKFLRARCLAHGRRRATAAAVSAKAAQVAMRENFEKITGLAPKGTG